MRLRSALYTLAVLAAVSAVPAGAAVEWLMSQRGHVRTRMNVRAEVELYRPTVEPVDGPVVILLSGEWGWTPLLQDTASNLAAHGRYVLGIDAANYFVKQLAPEAWKRDLRTLRAYANEQAGRPPESPVVLAGFSFGAELIPYMLNRGGAEGIAGVLLIAPDEEGSAVFRLALQVDELKVPAEERFDVGEEIDRMPPLPVVLLEGTLDMGSRGRKLFARVKGPRKYAPVVDGNHQFRRTREEYHDYVVQAIDWLEGAHEPEPPAAARQDGDTPPPAAQQDDDAPPAGNPEGPPDPAGPGAVPQD